MLILIVVSIWDLKIQFVTYALTVCDPFEKEALHW